MPRLRYYVIAGCFGFGLTVAVWLRLPAQTEITQVRVMIRQTPFQLEIAATPEARYRGLSGRPALAEHEGMVFVFDQLTRPTFVMRDMFFALDFLWIRGDTIMELTPEVPPPEHVEGELVEYKPTHIIDAVIELPGGSIRRFGLEVGDTIKAIDN